MATLAWLDFHSQFSFVGVRRRTVARTFAVVFCLATVTLAGLAVVLQSRPFRSVLGREVFARRSSQRIASSDVINAASSRRLTKDVAADTSNQNLAAISSGVFQVTGESALLGQLASLRLLPEESSAVTHDAAPGAQAVCNNPMSSYPTSKQCTKLVGFWQIQRAKLESDCISNGLNMCTGEDWKLKCTGGQWFRHTTLYITDTYPCSSACHNDDEKAYCCQGCRLIEDRESMQTTSSFTNSSATASTRKIECPGCCVNCQVDKNLPSASSQCQKVLPQEVMQAEHCMVSPCHTCGSPLDKAKCCAACLETRCGTPGNQTECWGCEGPETQRAVVAQVMDDVTEDITMSDRPAWYTWLGIFGFVLAYLFVIGLVVAFCLRHTKRENHWRHITVLGDDTISDTSWQPGHHPPRPDETDRWMGIFKGVHTGGDANAKKNETRDKIISADKGVADAATKAGGMTRGVELKPEAESEVQGSNVDGTGK